MNKYFTSAVKGLTISLLLMQSGCNQFIEVDVPPTRLLTQAVFDNEQTANSAVRGMYSSLYTNFSSNMWIPFVPGLLADEIVSSGNTWSEFYSNSLVPTVSLLSNIWRTPYGVINQANAIIEGLIEGGIDEVAKNRLMGEALFVRAFCHFYLVNYFGDVPLIVHTDIQKTMAVGRTPTSEVYQQIISDLEQAKLFLPDTYTQYANERVRATSHAASAFLARVYLYIGEWNKALENANSVIGKVDLYRLLNGEEFAQVFWKNNPEAIFQLQTYSGNGYTLQGNQFIPNSAVVIPAYILTNETIGSFEVNDLRRVNWIGSNEVNGIVYYYPRKYKQTTGTITGPQGEYDSTLRLGEQYLIRAEAHAQMNNGSLALADLNFLRHRAGIGDFEGSTVAEIILGIEEERRRELFCEWGHRWFDLIRTNRANSVLGNSKPNWEPTDKLLPIPFQELSLNPLLNQNSGYE